jgi:hypothetical protein
MIRFIIFLSFVLYQIPCFAQREYGVCDSTFYPLNSDTTVIAGRKKLYFYSNNTLSNVYDFTSGNPDEYIRDFDIVRPNLWFTVVGLRYIGGPTRLYKSLNKGNSWTLDTNHHTAANVQFLSDQFLKSINNLQHLNGDTLMMFMHYYESGILYSTDLGQTWTKWFDNLIAHYQGMFECGNKYYLFGYPGDGFMASMFGFDKALLFSSDSTGLWRSFNNLGYHPPCYNGNIAGCIYAPHQLTRCGSFNFFKRKIDTLCFATEVKENHSNFSRIRPNPFTDKLLVEDATGTEDFVLTDVLGQIVWEGRFLENQSFAFLRRGIYFLAILTEDSRRIVKLIRE